MAARTGIQWCDSTANYWEGCTKVSTEEQGGGGCDNCYVMGRAGKEAAGRLLDGREHNDLPKDFQ